MHIICSVLMLNAEHIYLYVSMYVYIHTHRGWYAFLSDTEFDLV